MRKNLLFFILAVTTAGGNLQADHARCTAYSPDEEDSLPYHGKNCMGFSVTATVEGYHQAATNHGWLPLGSIVHIDDVGMVIVTDTGSGVRWGQIDVCQEDREAVRAFPTGKHGIHILRVGWGAGSPEKSSSKHVFCKVPVPHPTTFRLATVHERQSSKRHPWV